MYKGLCLQKCWSIHNESMSLTGFRNCSYGWDTDKESTKSLLPGILLQLHRYAVFFYEKYVLVICLQNYDRPRARLDNINFSEVVRPRLWGFSLGNHICEVSFCCSEYKYNVWTGFEIQLYEWKPSSHKFFKCPQGAAALALLVAFKPYCVCSQS